MKPGLEEKCVAAVEGADLFELFRSRLEPRSDDKTFAEYAGEGWWLLVGSGRLNDDEVARLSGRGAIVCASLQGGGCAWNGSQTWARSEIVDWVASINAGMPVRRLLTKLLVGGTASELESRQRPDRYRDPDASLLGGAERGWVPAPIDSHVALDRMLWDLSRWFMGYQTDCTYLWDRNRPSSPAQTFFGPSRMDEGYRELIRLEIEPRQRNCSLPGARFIVNVVDRPPIALLHIDRDGSVAMCVYGREYGPDLRPMTRRTVKFDGSIAVGTHIIDLDYAASRGWARRGSHILVPAVRSDNYREAIGYAFFGQQIEMVPVPDTIDRSYLSSTAYLLEQQGGS